MNELSILTAAEETPDRDCLVVGGRVWSYREIASRVHAAMAELEARHVQSGHWVALVPALDLDSIVWLYALFELGCPAVLLHPRLTEREHELLMDQALPQHVIAHPPPVRAGQRSLPSVEPVPPDRTLAVVFTSGTSGDAKGAILSRRAFVASEAAHAANLGWDDADRWLLCMPPAHVGGLSILTRCLIARRCVVLSPGPFDPRQIVEVMRRDRATLLSVVPTMLRRLLDLEDPSWKPRPELRAVLVGGAPFSPALRAQAVRNEVPAVATYGCTEACSQVTTQTLDQVGTPGSGAPLRGIEVRVERGEIQIQGDVLMDGYIDEEQSRSAWTPDGWLRTADAGKFLPDGQLQALGRTDEILVSGGENVAPSEVEAWLESVPGVRAACVFSLPHAEWGEQVVAAIVADPAQYDDGTLRVRLRRELAPHKRPKRICLLEALPIGRSGKLDRTEVAKLCHGKMRSI